MGGYERKLLTLVGLIALAFLPILVASVYFLSTVSRSQDRLDALYTKTVILAHELRVEKMKQNALMPVIVITGERKLVDELRGSNGKFEILLGELRAQGGRLGVDTQPGQGSTFRVTLPLAA